jgi:hypothetical protein
MKTIFQALTTLILLAFFFSMPSFAAQYFVATQGSDTTGNGSFDLPWRTPQYGAKQLGSPGDVLYIREGTYQVSGTSSEIKNAAICPAAHNCAIRSYQGETVILDGGSAPTNGIIGDHDGSTIRNGLTIDGLIIKGIVVIMGQGTTVQNCDISVGGDSWGGIGQGEVIWVEASGNIIIRNNKIHSNTNRSDTSNSSLIMLYYGQNVTIENNEFYDSVGPAINVKGGNGTTEYVSIRYNYFHDNAAGAVWTANQSNPRYLDIYQNVFRNNASMNSAEFGVITLVINTRDARIYNNTFYRNYTGDFLKWTDATNTNAAFFNNLSVSPRNVHISFPYSNSQPTFTYLDYNCYYNGGAWLYRGARKTSLSAWRSSIQSNLSNAEANSLITDPNFVNVSGTFQYATDFMRLSYPKNGRGTGFAAVMGAYVKGTESIGYMGKDFIPNDSSQVPAFPKNLHIMK